MREPDLGDTVRIVSTPETVAAGYAGRTGTCYGFTTPSVTGVSVIGSGLVDRALNVSFDDGASAWFEPSFVIFLDLNAGQVIEIAGKRFVRTPTGEWVEDPGSNESSERGLAPH